LREIKCIAEVQEKQAEIDRQRRETRTLKRRTSRQTMQSTAEGKDEAIAEEEGEQGEDEREGTAYGDDATTTDQDWEGEGSGLWQPGQGVFIDHAAIMDIIIQHLSYPGQFLGPYVWACKLTR
jgi:vacuole morphology and inheritance protein 14